MSLTTKFMKWDGICFAEPTKADVNREHWRNQDSIGTAPGSKPKATGNTTLASRPNYGTTFSTPKAVVTFVSVSQMFAPIEEYAVIELQIKDIENVGCVLLQIKDADNQLVYAERLTRDMVLRLPDTSGAVEKLPPPLSKLPGTLSAQQKADRSKAKWANPVGTPYSITVWVTNNVCRDVLSSTELRLDVSSEVRQSSGREARNPYFIEKHKLKNPGGIAPKPAPALALEQTSVRLTGNLTPVLVPWEEVFEYLTDKKFPQATVGLTDDEKVLWAKCRLNQIGFSAGPIDTKKDQEDYVKAAKRYGAMRGVGGKVHYKVEVNPDEKTVTFDTLEKAFDSLTAADFPVLLGHLEKEGELAKSCKPISEPAKLGDGGSDPLKVYIDGNWFYVGDSDSHAKDAKERQWLTPPCLPMRALVHVLSRDGKTARDVPEALEPVFFQWTWRAPVEDPKRLPDPAASGAINAFNGAFDESGTFGLTGTSAAVYAKPQYRSKTRVYIDVARKRVAAKVPDQHDALYNNAPKCVGGLIADAPWNIQAVFMTWQKDPAQVEHRVKDRSASDLEPYLLAANKVDPSSPSSKGAVSVPGGRIYFCPSLIAGDQYELTVELFFDQQRTKASPDLAANKGRLNGLIAMNKPPGSAIRFTGSTRRLEGWRLLRVAKFIQWGDQPKTWDKMADYDRNSVWEAVKREYGFAYMEFQDGDLSVCTPADLTLATADYKDESAKKLKNDCVAAYKSLEEVVTAKLPDATRNHMIGRKHTGPNQFSRDFMLPPLTVKDVTLAAGQLPQVSDVLALVFLPALQLYKKIKSNALAGEELERFRAAYLLVREWENLDETKSPLHKAVQAAGKYLSKGLVQVIAYTPAREGGTFVWEKSGGDDVDPKTLGAPFNAATGDIEITSVGKSLFDVDYTHEDFAGLMDHFFLPEVTEGTRAELTEWVKGHTLEATRTIGLDALIKPLYPPLFDATVSDYRAGENYFPAWAMHRLHEYFGWILDGTSGFKNLPAEHRNLMLCMIHPAIVEATVHNALYANSATAKLGGNLALFLDQIVRKGILCRTDSAGQYQSFSDGMIVANARVYPSFKVGGQDSEAPGPSMGFPLGFVLTSHQSTSEPYALLAHEIAHVLYLMHDRNAGTVSASGFVFDHDHNDVNCMMSYPLNEVPRLATIPPTGANTYEANRLTRFVYLHIAGWQSLVDTMNAPGKWKAGRGSPEFMGNFGENAPVPVNRPHFCGKCALRLRGWDIYSQAPSGAVGGSPSSGAAAAFNWDEPENLDPVTSGHPDLLPISSRAPIHKMEVNRQYSGMGFVDVMGEEFTVEDGQSLCCVAMAMGHKDCSPIWSHPRNAGLAAPFVGKKVYVPRRRLGDARGTVPAPPTVHFIRGGKDPEGDLAQLNISNCSPNDSLVEGDAKFPDTKVRAYNADAYADEDAFQVEIDYPVTPPAGTIKGLVLKARKPLYDASGAFTGAYEDFPEAELKERSLDVELSAYPTGPNGAKRARSFYMRLVSLAELKKTETQNARPAQSLLIRDFYKVTGRGVKPDLWVEPLDQKVSAEFTISGCGCKPGEQCKSAPVEIPLEPARKTVDLAIRILRKVPSNKVCAAPNNVVYAGGMSPTPSKVNGNDSDIKIHAVQTNVMTYVRNVLAQAHVKVRITRMETVDPPSDMLTIENDDGRPAGANYNAAVKLLVKRFGAGSSPTDDPAVVIFPPTITKGSTPYQTAQTIAAEINAKNVPGVSAEAIQCVPMAGPSFTAGTVRAADVVLQCAPGVRVSMVSIGKADAQKIEVVTINPDKVIVDNSPRQVHVASAQQRCLFYAFDTGGTNVDVVFARDIANRSDQGCNGYGLGQFPDAIPTHPNILPDPRIRNSIIMSLEGATKPFLLVHEIGHVLIGTSMHVLGEDRFKGSLMWGNPGEPGVHMSINEHDPAADNWMNSKWDAEGNLIIDPVVCGDTRLNAVARILGHPSVHA